jgi:hypothetical protein
MTPFLAAAITEMLPHAGGGQECAECGFDWTCEGSEALDHIRAAPGRFDGLLRERDVTRSTGPGIWSASAYVWHVADLTRAWAERLHSLGTDPRLPWAGFDPDELAAARHYASLPPPTGPWAAARAVGDLEAALVSVEPDTGFVHPEWGEGTVADALRWVGHEAVHHELDVRRQVGLA